MKDNELDEYIKRIKSSDDEEMYNILVEIHELGYIEGGKMKERFLREAINRVLL